MVAGLFLVQRTVQGEADDRNRVRDVVVHEDDAQTDAQIIAAVIATLNTLASVGDGLPAHAPAGENVYPDGYFDTVTQIGASPAGPLATDGDLFAFGVAEASQTT